jgi:hypothetical protein
MTISTDISAATTAATQIDPTFPIAGRDNNSQGFRDNFDNIKTGMTNMVSALTGLNTRTPKLDENNDFNGQVIENAELRQVYGSVLNNGTTNTNENIDLRQGQYFTYTINANLTLTFSQWPAADKYAQFYVDCKSDGTARTLTFATTSGTIVPHPSLTLPYNLSANADIRSIFSVWSVDGGNKVFIRLVADFDTTP